MKTKITQNQVNIIIEDLYFKVENIINKFIEGLTWEHLDLEDLKDKVLNAIESERQ